MTQKVEDLRVRRTRKLLQKALLELTIEKGFADVTVRDIAERAMINLRWGGVSDPPRHTTEGLHHGEFETSGG